MSHVMISHDICSSIRYIATYFEVIRSQSGKEAYRTPIPNHFPLKGFLDECFVIISFQTSNDKKLTVTPKSLFELLRPKQELNWPCWPRFYLLENIYISMASGIGRNASQGPWLLRNNFKMYHTERHWAVLRGQETESGML